MINHFFVKEYLSFDEAKLYFEPGLVVFTGPSGSGKSILLNALLGVLAQSQSEAGMAEIEVSKRIELEEYGIESDDITSFKQLKKGNTRFFVNNQSITKKMMQEVSSVFIRHLSHKDFSDFEPNVLLAMIDTKVIATNPSHKRLLDSYEEHFQRFSSLKKELRTLEEEEHRLQELKEFAQYELEKIRGIDPKTGEDIELERIKKQLSKKEKIQEQIRSAQAIFELEYSVSQALISLDVESAFFDDAMNEVRTHFENADMLLEELEEIDIEAVLDRIESIAELKRRYGSIEEALAYREQKEHEVEKYDNFEEQKKRLKEEFEQLQEHVLQQADAIHVQRLGVVGSLEKRLNSFTKALYLREATISLAPMAMSKSGVDSVEIALLGANLQQISSGEFNRLRLALLAVQSEISSHNTGVLVLDEIDANLSGEESMSVAKVLITLSQQYQIFAISHQPQLTSQAHQHFLVYKDQDRSLVKSLKEDERIEEIARMISGDQITKEAKEFAQQLRRESLCVL